MQPPFTATSPYTDGYTARTTQYEYGCKNPIRSGRHQKLDKLWWWRMEPVGNPFTSAMEASTFITVNAGKFDPNYQALYIYDGMNVFTDMRYFDTRVIPEPDHTGIMSGWTGIFCTCSLQRHCVHFQLQPCRCIIQMSRC